MLKPLLYLEAPNTEISSWSQPRTLPVDVACTCVSLILLLKAPSNLLDKPGGQLIRLK